MIPSPYVTWRTLRSDVVCLFRRLSRQPRERIKICRSAIKIPPTSDDHFCDRTLNKRIECSFEVHIYILYFIYQEREHVSFKIDRWVQWEKELIERKEDETDDKSTCKYRSMNRMKGKGFTLTSFIYLFIYFFFFSRFTSFDPAEIFDA